MRAHLKKNKKIQLIAPTKFNKLILFSLDNKKIDNDNKRIFFFLKKDMITWEKNFGKFILALTF
jgi:hypothetical protein